MSEDLVDRLRKRAEIRRQIDSRKSVQEGKPDRLAAQLDEAADRVERLESYLCAITFDMGFKMGVNIRPQDDGLDMDGFVNLKFDSTKLIITAFEDVDLYVRRLAEYMNSVFERANS